MYVCIGHLGWLNAERLKEFRNQFKWWPKALRSRVWLEHRVGINALPVCVRSQGVDLPAAGRRKDKPAECKKASLMTRVRSDGEGAMNDLTQQMQSQLGLENKSLGSSPN